MRRKIAFVLTAALAAAPALMAQKQAPPAPGKPRGFSVPAPKTFQLDNGLSVTLVPYGAVALVTDYDAGVDGQEPVTMDAVLARMRENVALVRDLIARAAPLLP